MQIGINTWEDSQATVWLQLLYHRGKWLSPQMEAAIAHLTAALQNSPSGF